MTARSGTAACLCVLASSLVTVAATAAPSAREMTPPHFQHTAGWVVVSRSRTEPWISSSMVIAVTAPDVAAVRPFAAFTSLKRLSPRGILVWAGTIGRNRPTFAPMQWPPQLSSFRLDRAWEGQPAPRVQQRLKWGVTNGWDMEVRVYFGTQHPDKQLIQKAQAQIDRIVLPSR